MRSLHIIGSTQMGGADQFFVRLVTALNAAGHQALAVTRRGSPIAGALQGSAVEQIHLPLANKWDLWSRWQIARLARARDVDIVQTYMGRATRLTHLPAGQRPVHLARLGGYYKLDGYYRHAHGWIGNTRKLCDWLIEQGLPREQVYLIGNFVPEPAARDSAAGAQLRQRHGIASQARVLFTLGRFISIKGFDDLLDAFARLPAQLDGRPLHLVIGGDGELREALLAQRSRLGLDTRVHFPGWLAAPGDWYHEAELMLCPSRHETLGNVILEGWSYAKPVLATTTPGASELIRDGENGWLTAVAEVPALAGCLEKVLTLPAAERDAVAARGHTELLAHHGRDAVVRQYLELYARLTAGRQA